MDQVLADWLGIAADATSLTVPLKEKITVGGTEYTELTLVEPTLGQMEEAGKKTGLAEDIALIAVVAKVSDQVARALPASGYKKAVAFLNVFLMAAPPAGNDPS